MPIASVGVGTTTSTGRSGVAAASVTTTQANGIDGDTTPPAPRGSASGAGLSPFRDLERVPGMEVVMNVPHVRVVGAGAGGLLTAALLRARGVDAVVVERASKPGGRA